MTEERILKMRSTCGIVCGDKIEIRIEVASFFKYSFLTFCEDLISCEISCKWRLNTVKSFCLSLNSRFGRVSQCENVEPKNNSKQKDTFCNDTKYLNGIPYLVNGS